jgi:hypothetical protein
MFVLPPSIKNQLSMSINKVKILKIIQPKLIETLSFNYFGFLRVF